MDIATKVLIEVAPDLTPPRSVRSEGDAPRVISTKLNDQQTGLVQVIKEELKAVDTGNLAVIAATSQVEEIEELLTASRVDFGRPTRTGLDSSITVVPVGLVKGLEVDAAVVVEPKRIVEEQEQGLRALYVALTRATKRVAIVHSDRLPEVLRQF
jgi:DNA helicase IV